MHNFLKCCMNLKHRVWLLSILRPKNLTGTATKSFNTGFNKEIYIALLHANIFLVVGSIFSLKQFFSMVGKLYFFVIVQNANTRNYIISPGHMQHKYKAHKSLIIFVQTKYMQFNNRLIDCNMYEFKTAILVI